MADHFFTVTFGGTDQAHPAHDLRLAGSPLFGFPVSRGLWVYPVYRGISPWLVPRGHDPLSRPTDAGAEKMYQELCLQMIHLDQLGLRIAEGRRALGLTQGQVAACMGVTPQAVSKWERGLACPDITFLDELADLLCTSIDQLLTGRCGCAGCIGSAKSADFVQHAISSRTTA